MPIWLRKYTFNSIKEFYDKEKEEYQKQINKANNNQDITQIAKPPAAKPTYTTKAPKK